MVLLTQMLIRFTRLDANGVGRLTHITYISNFSGPKIRRVRSGDKLIGQTSLFPVSDIHLHLRLFLAYQRPMHGNELMSKIGLSGHP